MSQESPLDRWYVGESKMLRWTVEDRRGQIVPVTGWNAQVYLYRRRADAPLETLTALVENGPAGVLACTIPASTTTTLGPGSYRAVLFRMDPGAEQVIDSRDIILKPRGQ